MPIRKVLVLEQDDYQQRASLSATRWRAPRYVSREVGAFELCVTEQTWDELVRLGHLPPPVSGLPRVLKRWLLSEVDLYLLRPFKERKTRRSSSSVEAQNADNPEELEMDNGVKGAKNIRGPDRRFGSRRKRVRE